MRTCRPGRGLVGHLMYKDTKERQRPVYTYVELVAPLPVVDGLRSTDGRAPEGALYVCRAGRVFAVAARARVDARVALVVWGEVVSMRASWRDGGVAYLQILKDSHL